MQALQGVGARAGAAALGVGPPGWLWAGVRVLCTVAAAGRPSLGPGCRVACLGTWLGQPLLGVFTPTPLTPGQTSQEASLSCEVSPGPSFERAQPQAHSAGEA